MTGTMKERGACGGSPVSNAFVMALVATAVLLAGAEAWSGTTLGPSPGTVTVEATSAVATVEFDVAVTDVTLLTGFEFKIHNPDPDADTQPRVSAVAAGGWWQGDDYVFNTGGQDWGFTSLGYEYPTVTGKTGNGALAHVTVSYTGATPGTYVFTIDSAELVDTALAVIPTTTSNFTLVVEAAQAPQPDPPGLLVTDKTTSSITLESSACSDRTGPVRYQFNKGTPSPGTTFRVWDASHLAQDTALSANTQHTYRVRAEDATVEANATGWSGDVSAYTLPVSPDVVCDRAAPGSYPVDTLFTFTNIAGWGAGALDHVHYVWSTAATHTFDGTEATWIAGTLPLPADLSGNWYLHVMAHNEQHDSGGEQTLGPFNVGDLPDAPTLFAHSGNGVTTITWTWTDKSGNETGFRVDPPGGTVGADATSWMETGLSANTAYTRHVTAYNDFGDSAPSDDHTAYTSIEQPSGVAFGVVTTSSIEAQSANTPSNLTSGASGLIVRNATAATSSGWRQDNAYWDSAPLTANKAYAFNAEARNGDGDLTGPCADEAKWTLPVAPDVTCDLSLGGHYPTGMTFTFTNEVGWGEGALEHYHYVWSTAATHSFDATEATWDAGTLPLAAGAPGDWYLHVMSHNGEHASGGELVIGPFDVGDLPAGPTAFAHSGNALTTITWTWTDNSGNETGFRVDPPAGTVGADVTTWTETGLSANTAYTRHVTAYNTYGDSAPSDDHTAYTSIERPSGVAFGVVTTSSIEARSANTPSNLTSGASGLIVRNATAATDSGWKQDNAYWESAPLTANKTYAFNAEARNGDGDLTGPCADEAKWTLPVAPDVTCDRAAPGSYPVGTVFTFTNIAGWGEGALEHYHYVWSTAATHTFDGTEATWAAGTLPLAAGAPGDWYLHVMSHNGEHASGGTLILGPFDVGHLPDAPMAFAHSGNGVTTITWTWTDNSGNETGFRVDPPAGTVGADVTSWTETGLSANTAYTRHVTAYNAYGDSAPSDDHTAYTSIETPAGVSFGTVAETTIDLDATGTLSNLAAGASGVYFDEAGGSNTGIHEWLQITSDTATGLLPNTEYAFRAMARNGDGDETPFSITSQKYTLANQPVAAALTSISETSIQANWTGGTPANPAGTAYTLECYEGAGFGGTRKFLFEDITSLTLVVSGLEPNRQYSFRVMAENHEGLPTGWTDLGTAYTLANTPGALVIDTEAMDGEALNLTAPGCRSLSIVSIDLNSNPAGTLVAIKLSSGQWLRLVDDDNGHLDAYADSPTEDWRTAAEWAGKRLRGLAPGGTYGFRAKAVNEEAIETALEDVGTYSTNLDGDVNDSGSTTISDLLHVRNAVLTGGDIGVHYSWATDVNDNPSRRTDISDMSSISAIILQGGP